MFGGDGKPNRKGLKSDFASIHSEISQIPQPSVAGQTQPMPSPILQMVLKSKQLWVGFDFVPF